MTKSEKGRILELDNVRAAIVALIASGAMDDRDIARIQSLIETGGYVSRDMADALFDLECAPMAKSAGWTEFFVEHITAHVVWEMRPTGVVNEGQGEWLIVRADGAKSLNALAVLVNVLSEAHRVPLWFLAAVKARAAARWPGTSQVLAAAQAEAA